MLQGLFFRGFAMTLATLAAGHRQQIMEIMTSALRSVDPAEAVRRHLQRDGSILQVGDQAYDLDRFQHVILVGVGKAGVPMATAAAAVLGERLTSGIIVVKLGHTTVSTWQVRCGRGGDAPLIAAHTPLPITVEVIEAGHPVPNQAGLIAAQRVQSLVSGLSVTDLVICLISGGGSALLPAPVPGISLSDKQALTELLLRSGATINQINAVRKHCSTLKGGQLARQAAPATVIALLLSDVVGSPLDVIASGMTVPDSSTFAEAYEILEQYDVADRAPASVLTHLQQGTAGAIPETPKANDPCFDRVQTVVVGDNRIAANAAAMRARSLGFSAQVLTTFVEGEAREVARVCAALLKEEVSYDACLPRPACLILGGETTVTVRGTGKGGRNQELALAAALALDGYRHVAIASLGTDGTDGPTDAAGAIASGETIRVGMTMGLNPGAALNNNDAYTFFSALGDLILTGPTGTNVNDLILAIAWPDEG